MPTVSVETHLVCVCFLAAPVQPVHAAHVISVIETHFKSSQEQSENFFKTLSISLPSVFLRLQTSCDTISTFAYFLSQPARGC